jgi:hypothetical protein
VEGDAKEVIPGDECPGIESDKGDAIVVDVESHLAFDPGDATGSQAEKEQNKDQRCSKKVLVSACELAFSAIAGDLGFISIDIDLWVVVAFVLC